MKKQQQKQPWWLANVTPADVHENDGWLSSGRIVEMTDATVIQSGKLVQWGDRHCENMTVSGSLDTVGEANAG